MERQLADGEDRHLRAAVQSGIVECADFQDHRGQTRPSRGQVRTEFGIEFPRHGAFKIAALALGRIAYRAAAASAFQFPGILPKPL